MLISEREGRGAKQFMKLRPGAAPPP